MIIIPKNQKGFTLIEMMMVVAIIGILAAVCIPLYMSYIQKSRIRSLVYPGLHIIETNISLYYASTGLIPVTASISSPGGAPIRENSEICRLS